MPTAETHTLKMPHRWGLTRQFALLIALLVVAALITMPVGWLWFGTAGLTAAVVAAGFCLLGGLATLLACHFYAGRQPAMFAVVAGMLLRTSIPLALALVARGVVPEVFASGLMYFLLIDYLVCLAAETWLVATKVHDLGEAAGRTSGRVDDPRRAHGIS